MEVRFTITMEDAIVCGQFFDLIIIEWIDDMTETKVLNISHDWINTSKFLTSRMSGLSAVGESSLSIEPL